MVPSGQPVDSGIVGCPIVYHRPAGEKGGATGSFRRHRDCRTVQCRNFHFSFADNRGTGDGGRYRNPGGGSGKRGGIYRLSGGKTEENAGIRPGTGRGGSHDHIGILGGKNCGKLEKSISTNKKVLEENTEKHDELKKILEDEKAREKFIHGNLRLVLSVIKRFYGRGENVDDLFQVGCIGLIKAIDNFDVTLNVQFSTYAVPMIVGEIRRYLRDNNMVRVSRSVRDLAYKVLAVREKALRENKKEPTIDEIAKELGVEKEEIAFCLDAIQDPVSLQEPVYGDDTENIYVEDQIKDKKNSDENWADDITLLEVMKKLKEKERNIINKRFFEGRTQMEVAEEIGISQAQVSRLEKNAIEHIKKLYN